MKYLNIYTVLIIAFLIRLIALNQSLWLDEATTAQTIQHFSYIDLVKKFAPNDFHPPLYYLFMKAWTSVFGYSEIALRMPSVIFSLVSGWYVYLIGKKLVNKQTGLWSAAFFLFNPLVVYYSQEARMYMMVTCFLTIAIYLFLNVIPSGAKPGTRQYLAKRSRATILLNLFLALSLFTFYGSIFLIAAFYLYILVEGFMDPRVKPEDDIKRNVYRQLLTILPGPIIALLILSPLLYTQYNHSKEMLSLVPNWSLVLGKANVKNLLLIPIKFSIGRIQFEPKRLYYLAAGAWTFFVFCYIALGGLKNKMLGMLFAAPLILGFIFSFFTPLLQYFRFVYLIPLYALLIIYGLSEKFKRILYLTVFVLLSLVYLLRTDFHRENWKVLAQTIKPEQTVYMVYSSSDPLQYYFNQNKNTSKIKDLKPMNTDLTEKIIVVIPYTADIHRVTYKDYLKKKGYQNIITFNSRELTSEVWQKK